MTRHILEFLKTPKEDIYINYIPGCSEGTVKADNVTSFSGRRTSFETADTTSCLIGLLEVTSCIDVCVLPPEPPSEDI
jgi:hypothetical protein